MEVQHHTACPAPASLLGSADLLESAEVAPRVTGRAIVGESRQLVYNAAKRVFDVVLAACLLVLLSPMLLAIALAIKLESPGPVLFRQERMGSRRRCADSREYWMPRSFTVLKFRSMCAGSDSALHEAHIDAFVKGELVAGERGSRFKLPHDPRLTVVGAVLRRISLDELPQLVNVLRGEMSLVGPRPVPMYEAAYHTERERERLGALPGITGLWQVSGRADLPYEQMVQLDLDYVRRKSLWLDLKILALTIPAVLGQRGAA